MTIATASGVITPVRPRVRALDWLRGIAVLVMVECHVFNEFLAPAYRSAGWFQFFNWLNGFVAPAFLLVSGAVIGLNLQNRWGKSTRKMWRRIGQIFIIAYLLHFPTLRLWEFFGPRGPHLVEVWSKMDILQCIGGSLAVVLLLVPVARTPKIHRALCAVLGIAATTSVVAVGNWASDGMQVPKPLLNYLWPTGLGLFPLVPWGAFIWLGVLLGPAIFSESSRARQCLRAAIGGIIFITASHLMAGSGTYDARFVFERLGFALLALAACVWIDAPIRGTRWILQFGELSLWSYTVHLMIVFTPASLGLEMFRPQFSPGVVTFALVVVLVVTAIVVRWRANSLERQQVAHAVKRG
jgi:uncharacterized membrane protein